MVNYKVRTFCEEDIDSVGAEVRIYSDEDEKIDTILITTESQYRELASRIDNMDANYLDREELIQILQNASSENLNIEAATLDGFSSDDFAKTSHNELHTDFFAPINHAIETNRYGLGSTTKYGHVKTIDNLNASTLQNGEALSAHQGNVLKSLIDAVKQELTTWNVITTSVGRLEVNKSLRIAQFKYVANHKVKTKDKWENVKTGVIPTEYCPPGTIVQPASLPATRDTFIKLGANGTLSIISSQVESSSFEINAMWKY